MVAPKPTVQSQNLSRSWLPHLHNGSSAALIITESVRCLHKACQAWPEHFVQGCHLLLTWLAVGSGCASRAWHVGLFINDKRCKSIQVPIPDGDGDFQGQMGPERPSRPHPLSYHPKVMPREVKGLTWCHTEVGPPWLGLGHRSPDWIYDFPSLSFRPRPQSGVGSLLRPCSLGLGGMVRGNRSCTERLFLLRPWLCMEAWAVCVCKPQLPSTRILEPSMWLPLFLSLSFSAQEGRIAW